MISRIQLLRNVGQFDSVSPPNDFTKLTMIYAENGRGKTTFASILRSVSTGNAAIIGERRRLGAQHPPHVILRDQGGVIAFQNGAWSRTMPEIAVFDDRFVSENVCSGVEIEAGHRQNLHELILGAQGVALNAAVQGRVAQVEEHNKQLRILAEAIPAAARGRYTVDAFCALTARPEIDVAIREAEQGLAAAKSADSVRSQPVFQRIALPAFDAPTINRILEQDLPGLETAAAARVQAHIKQLGRGGESWIAEGVLRIDGFSATSGQQTCPFCAQDLNSSSLISCYTAYFSQSYASLKSSIVDQGKGISATHEADGPAAFERAVRVAVQTREFWSAFTLIPEIELDTADISRVWKLAREEVLTALRAKHAAPLDRTTLPATAIDAIAAYDRQRAIVAAMSSALLDSNAAIGLVKERTASANVATLEGDLALLQAIQARHSLTINAACEAYIAEKAAKVTTERARDQARVALNQYRTAIFPVYERAINNYLRRLGASFRLDSVTSVNNRGGSSCTYNVLINDTAVPITATVGPSFRNTLSAGDRNTLALAFFFASLEHDPTTIGQKIIVIDDPMTSLDEHRNRNTLQEIRLLLNRVAQLIVLSHSKSFLCPLWQDAAPTLRSALRIDRIRDGQNQDASTITDWNVHLDCVTEHDRRHEQVAAYIQNADPLQERVVAAALRPILESFVRVSYPTVFGPGDLLGPFINTCRQRVGTAREVLGAADVQELDYLLRYANEFHHDSNPAFQTVLINSQQLTDFCQRTVNFARRA